MSEQGGKFRIVCDEHCKPSPTPVSVKEIEAAQAEFVNWHEAVMAGIETLDEPHSYEEPVIEAYIDYDGRWAIAR